ncbi:GspH/FimT family pseudopilin [Thalassotalea agarivorans]|uniref:Type II secretion system protein H n=1 Tax=Thalassotalea agarivorans TaxID=349064 RepID=A0A1H9YT53_THASX|nr:GspH/FimT family pseudopilin [Thalassotalea agarivorans]SES72300.1 type IV fimbrial biogenesis protein FimT [Thalassotalea agarivorans]
MITSHYTSRAFSLLEGLITVCLIAIFMSISLPSIEEFIVKQRVQKEIITLQRTLSIARNYAVNYGDVTVVCPLKNNKCSNDWQSAISVFSDANRNYQLDSKEEVINISESSFETNHRYFSSKRRYIAFAPTGRLRGLSNGTFKICPIGMPRYAKGLIVSPSGRTYKSVNQDSSDIEKTRSGKTILCN